ncbi:MAG TPA: ABC1 kinase family protein [Candidatus Wujingus californicus]|uniref:ABC1 kinase family protein n=2 Tax=Candidatus Wujingus californicus TaxID=3367618 RepID=UPI001D763817|nr:AarF/ABC1/UbiB kinase family protein [Planctomycetota bacterium]MDO8132310.1 AarF/ABC1/UbiB kinase family protein [Candidatus Brocadiales bacterium]
MQLRKIGQKIRDIRRFNQILRILTKHGFGFAIQQLHLERHVIGRGVIKIRMLKRFTEPQESRSVRLRKVLEELGPTFIKLGQILSVRPDLIPIDLCDELSKLQDQVPPFDYGDIKKQIKESLGSYPEELFSAFNSTPIAAASLGQAHQARLKTGEDVVVKVQRPDIRRTIETDIDILYTLAQLAGRYMADIKVFDPISIVNEFSKVITKEIDFTHEAHNIDKFCKNFKDSVTVRIPKVFWEYTRSKVITTEEIKGIRLNDYLNQPHSNEEKRTVALNGANAILQQIFVNGFFHADPHPGNIFILPDNVVAFVDFGIVGRLDEDSRDAIVSLLIAVSMKNARGIIKALESLGAFTEDVPIRSFKHDINDFMERYYDIPLKQIEISTVLQQAIDSMLRYKLKIPHQFHVLFKAITTIDGVARQLDPEFNTIAHTRPFVEKLVRERHDPSRMLKDAALYSSELLDIIKIIPRDAYEILKKIKMGTLKIEFEHQGLSKFIAEMDKSSNRVSFSLVISALIIGSSLIIMANKGPLVYSFPVLGILGFIFAGILGLGLAIAILRSGRL